jgi:hypothetical protein
MSRLHCTVNDVLQKPADGYEARGRLDPAGFERHVCFQTFAPPAPLAPFVAHFWTLRWENLGQAYPSEEVMHRPYVDLFVSQTQSGVQGTFRGKRTYVATGNGRIVGTRLRPGALRAFWDGKVTDLQDEIIDLQQVLPQMNRGHIEHVLSLDDAAVIDDFTTQLAAKIRNLMPTLSISTTSLQP